jgi:hypothetical protein
MGRQKISQLHLALAKGHLEMNRPFLATILGALLLFTAACKSKTNDKDAIRNGVLKHLASLNMLNMANMDVTVTQATINGNQAQAQVEVRAKGTDPAAGAMQLTYSLEKRGEEWVVLKGTPTGGMAHPAPGEAPPPNLPPGQPGAGGTSGQTPPGHPDFNQILKTAQPPAQQPPAQQQPAQQQPQPPAYPPAKP